MNGQEVIKIGVVSDTHGRPLPEQMLADFKTVDLIVHAGDLCSIRDLETLSCIKEVKAVFGNMDGEDIRSQLPEDVVFRCGNYSFGVYHGGGAPKQLLEKVRDHFKKKKLDAIIFGHSHEPMNEVVDGILFFNPGSPNDHFCASCCTYGVLDISEQGIQGRIIKVK